MFYVPILSAHFVFRTNFSAIRNVFFTELCRPRRWNNVCESSKRLQAVLHLSSWSIQWIALRRPVSVQRAHSRLWLATKCAMRLSQPVHWQFTSERQIHRLSNIGHRTETATTIITTYRCLWLHPNLVRPRFVCCNREFHTMNFITTIINCNLQMNKKKSNGLHINLLTYTLYNIHDQDHNESSLALPPRRSHKEIQAKLRKFSHSDCSRKGKP